MSYEVVSNWLPTNKYPLKATYSMTPLGIVVHNTAGAAGAQEEVNNMINNNSATSYHVCIDENYAVEAIPFNRNAWHAGDGSNGFANRNLIGIEIARSMDYSSDNYDKAEANAVDYIAYVCIQFGWDSSKLNQHQWYSSTACPHRLHDHWDAFCAKVDAKIKEIQSGEGTTKQDPTTDNTTNTNKDETVYVVIHGKEDKVKGFKDNGKIYVGVRDMLTKLGYNVEWKNHKVYIEYK